MIIVMAAITVKPEKKGALVPLTLDLILNTRGEKGCISYELFSSTENDYSQTFVEKWESMEALNEHMKSPHFISFGEKTKDFFSKPMEIKLYEANEA